MTDVAARLVKLEERLHDLELGAPGTVTEDHEDRIRALERALWRRVAGGSSLGAGGVIAAVELLKQLLGG